MNMSAVTIGVVMGSSSDWDTLQHAVQILQEFAHLAFRQGAHEAVDRLAVLHQDDGRDAADAEGPRELLFLYANVGATVFAASVLQLLRG